MNTYRYQCSLCGRSLWTDLSLLRWRCGDGCMGVMCKAESK